MTEAIYDFWEYYEPVREYGPPDCILATQRLTNIVDNILLGKNSSMGLITELKTAFGLQDVQYVLPLIEVFRIMSAAQTIDSFPVLRISGASTCKKRACAQRALLVGLISRSLLKTLFRSEMLY